MRITNHEWNQFWATLGKDWYFEDSDMPEGIDAEGTKPGDSFTFTCGGLYYQGDKANPKPVPGLISLGEVTGLCERGGCSASLSLTAIIRRWRKAQTVEVVTVELPKGMLAGFELAVSKFGGKVLK